VKLWSEKCIRDGNAKMAIQKDESTQKLPKLELDPYRNVFSSRWKESSEEAVLKAHSYHYNSSTGN